MSLWTPEMIRFMKDASEYAGYYRALAQKIAEIVPETSHICDAGCGLGDLSLALSERFDRVTAVDIAPQATAVLQKKLLDRPRPNLECRTGDIARMVPQTPYDAMVFCFFGRIDQALAIARAQCRGQVLLLLRNSADHRFAAGRPPRACAPFEFAKGRLDEMKIPYRAQAFEIEFGQPFENPEDALKFFRVYAEPDAAPPDPEEILKRLQRTNSEAFPFYLPSKNPIGMIAIRTEDIV